MNHPDHLPHSIPAGQLLPGRPVPANAVMIGGDEEALGWIPRLLRDPQINLIGLVPHHPADLIRHLEDYGYVLTDPNPLTLFPRIAALGEVNSLDLIIDTTLDPAVVRALSDTDLGEVARVNLSALGALLARPQPTVLAPRPSADGQVSEKLAKEVGRAYRHGRSLGLVIVQLGETEDTFAGDLTHSAIRVIEESLRIEDVVLFREPGQFSILLPETGEATRYVADRLTSNLGNLRIPNETSSGVPVGAGQGAEALKTVGWACFPQDAKTAPALMAQALARMGPPKSQDS